MIIYSVHDVLADTWSFPQVSPTEASTKRDFEQLKSRPNVPSSDLECVIVGVWNLEKGEVTRSDRYVLVPAASSESPNE